MPQKDPYTILGVPRSASADEIKAAYRKLAKENHPDRNPDNPGAVERFKDAQAAYEVLGDADKRAQFDRFGAGGPRPDFGAWGKSPGAGFGGFSDGGGANFGNFGDLSSIFEQFFSRGGGDPRTAQRAAAPRGGDVHHSVSVSFEEAMRGTTRDVLLARHDGREERLEVQIPAGVRDQQKVRLRDKGNPGPGGNGDLLINISVRPHPFFRLDGRNLLLDVPLSITEAALGTRLEIPTLGGTAVLTIPPGTSSHTKLRLKGKGLPATNIHAAGDLLVQVKIEAPSEPSPDARKLLEQLAEQLDQQPRRHATWGQQAVDSSS